MNNKWEEQVMRTCLLAGEIMLKSGGETYRVEGTMTHIAQAAGMTNIHGSATPTSIIFSYCGSDGDYTRMIRIQARSTDLNKIALVNEVSRQYVSGKINLSEAFKQLQIIDQKKPQYPSWLLHIVAGVASGSFAVLAGATFLDFLPTVLSGLLVNVAVYYSQQVLGVKFFAEFFAAFLGGLFILFIYYFFSSSLHLDIMLIGTMLPLFPGVAVTNSLRDLMAGDLVAGVSRGVEAILTALSVAIATAILLFFIH